MRHGLNLFVAVVFLGTSFVLWTTVSDPQMLFSHRVTVSVAALAQNAAAQSSIPDSSLSGSIDAKWHAPDLDYWDTDLDAVINATGTYGYIFNTSALPEELKYGSYNYCNMPHVRRAEYQVAPKEYNLEYVEVIHRHHKRTPYASNLAYTPLALICQDMAVLIAFHSFPARLRHTTATTQGSSTTVLPTMPIP